MRRVDPGADFDVQLTLERARVAREPSLADKQRLLASLQVRLGDVPSLPSAGESTTGVRLTVPKLHTPSVGARAAQLGRSLVSSKAALNLLWVGAATGALGFWLGAHVTETTAAISAAGRGGGKAGPSSLSVPMAETKAPLLSAPVVPAPVVPARAAPPPAARVGAELEPPPIPATRAADASPHPLPTPPVVPAQRAPSRTLAARGPLGRGAAAPAVDPNARFLEAVRLLSRAQRALDGGEPALALVLLEELDGRVPRELLSEERQAALIIALCKSGEAARARGVAAELAASSPSSIYAARIVRSCGNLAEAAPAPGNTDSE
jgi:hypothetical protein